MEIDGEVRKVRRVVADMAHKVLIDNLNNTGIANLELLQLTWIDTYPDTPVPTGTFYTAMTEALNKYRDDDDDNAGESSATPTQSTIERIAWTKAHYCDLLARLQDLGIDEFSSAHNFANTEYRDWQQVLPEWQGIEWQRFNNRIGKMRREGKTLLGDLLLNRE